MAKAKGHPLSQAYVASRQDALCPAPKALHPLPSTPYFLNTLGARLKRDALTTHARATKRFERQRQKDLSASDKKTPVSETVLPERSNQAVCPNRAKRF